MMLRLIPALIWLAAVQPRSQSAPLSVKEESAGLLKQAKITPEAALSTAAAKVPGMTLKSVEIEREDGKLLYVFSFAKASANGEDEVSVNALTGVLHKVEPESAEDEAREAPEDVAKVKRKTAGSAVKPSTSAKPIKPPVG